MKTSKRATSSATRSSSASSSSSSPSCCRCRCSSRSSSASPAAICCPRCLARPRAQEVPAQVPRRAAQRGRSHRARREVRPAAQRLDAPRRQGSQGADQVRVPARPRPAVRRQVDDRGGGDRSSSACRCPRSTSSSSSSPCSSRPAATSPKRWATSSRVLRNRKKMKQKIKAMSSEAKASAGIIGSLPFLVAILVSLTTPAYLLPLIQTPIGNDLARHRRRS